MGQKETKDNKVQKVVNELDPSKVQCRECGIYIDKSIAKVITITTRGVIESNAVCEECFKKSPGINDYFSVKKIHNADTISINEMYVKNRWGNTRGPVANLVIS